LDFKDGSCLPAATTAAATAAAVATSTTAATCAAAGALSFRTRLIDVESASPNLSSIQSGNGFIAFFSIRHFDEAKAARTSGVAVRHDGYSINLPILLEQLAQFVLASVETEIPNEDVLQANASVTRAI
jgi:hypothetical protein